MLIITIVNTVNTMKLSIVFLILMLSTFKVLNAAAIVPYKKYSHQLYEQKLKK
ncbi:hypothetical protein [Lonomia obliqua multiple nucleopolyhedrovirus]|uniref:Uncharacterized protein n=1 Tax=Lonomia obliqua multiple nucleopolyhedrovirus TaxID=134394 RepID=A0A126FCC0_9ABAC|nr:hypothetical protein [Lonomia obliqua multiple nucleopolyhedrovirus]AKN81046.1 hypothetical protein [Lonomia obliqua multiple nucleopolyhedrovirus]